MHAILDEAIVGYVGWVRDGSAVRHARQRVACGCPAPVACLGRQWHGPAAIAGQPVCVTVAHVDGLVLARSATNHSIDYRSVMALGVAHRIEDDAEIASALEALVESLYPGRWAQLRPMTDAERRATAVFWIALDEASAKVRNAVWS